MYSNSRLIRRILASLLLLLVFAVLSGFLPDASASSKESHSLVAQYQDLKWEVTSVSLDYDISHKVTVDKSSASSVEQTRRSVGTFSWNIGADGRIEAGVGVKGKLSASPLEGFGLLGSEAQGQFSVTIAGRGGVERSGSDQKTELDACKNFLSISDQEAMGNLHFTFSVGFYNYTSHRLVFEAKPIPILIGNRHVVNAVVESEQVSGGQIVIPAKRTRKPVVISFRADLNNTKAFELVDWMRKGNSPDINMANSQITIQSPNDPSGVDLISQFEKLVEETQLLTVRTSGGSTSWRIMKRIQGQPVTIGQALQAVNDLIRKTETVDRDFFQFDNKTVVSVAGLVGEDFWLVRSKGRIVIPNNSLLSEAIDAPVEFFLVERAVFREVVEEVNKQYGLKDPAQLIKSRLPEIGALKIAEQRNWPEAVLLQAFYLCSDNPMQAVRLFKKAAESGSTDGMCQLGACYLGGFGMAKDEVKAFEWFKKSADLGNPYGMCSMGMCYQGGFGVAKDEGRAFEWFKKAAELGNSCGIFTLGGCYLKGAGVAKDEQQAFFWFNNSAHLGDPYGMNGLGDCYAGGVGVAKDVQQAFKWYKKAADLGNHIAMLRLGDCYQSGFGVAKDAQRAFQLYKQLADTDDADGMVSLATCYTSGVGVAKDDQQAFTWYKKAADLGNANGMYWLGVCYAVGVGVAQDRQKAFEWYKKSAELGNTDGMTHVGTYYHGGLGVVKDDGKAFEWFKKAAELGNAEGMERLGVCYRSGWGVAKDDQQAFEWFKKSANLGNAGGMFYFGGCYLGGFGVAKDEVKAFEWFKKAAELGDSNAKEVLKALER